MVPVFGRKQSSYLRRERPINIFRTRLRQYQMTKEEMGKVVGGSSLNDALGVNPPDRYIQRQRAERILEGINYYMNHRKPRNSPGFDWYRQTSLLEKLSIHIYEIFKLPAEIRGETLAKVQIIAERSKTIRQLLKRASKSSTKSAKTSSTRTSRDDYYRETLGMAMSARHSVMSAHDPYRS